MTKDRTENYEVPKDELPPGIKYKKIYGQRIEKQNPKFGKAPGHLKVLPHLEWNLHRGD